MTTEANVRIVDSELMNAAEKNASESKLIHETPMLSNVGHFFNLPENIELHLKLENMQTTGSFKIRGVLNQFANLKINNDSSKFISFSAGNYGKAFAFMCAKKGVKGKVILPKTAAESRMKYIESQGCEVEKADSGEDLLRRVDDHVKQGWTLVHPLDDIYLLAGYISIAKEILKVVEKPDIVLVCCGGGTLLAGIASGLNLLGSNATVYGVEPETANTMYESLKQDYPVKMFTSHSIASGLSPPMAGTVAFNHCKKFVKGIILLTDEEIKSACKVLFERGLKVEPSGSAAMAAVLFNKIPNVDVTKPNDRKLKIVSIISGGNVSAEELAQLFQS